jgi:hypothetical protein
MRRTTTTAHRPGSRQSNGSRPRDWPGGERSGTRPWHSPMRTRRPHAIVHPPRAVACQAGEMQFAARLDPAAAAARADRLGLLNRPKPFPCATAARQPGVGLHARSVAERAAHPWLRHVEHTSSQADRAGRERGQQADRIAPTPVAERAAHHRICARLSHTGGSCGTHRNGGGQPGPGGSPATPPMRRGCSRFPGPSRRCHAA